MNEAPSMATQRTHHSETARRTAILVTGAGGEMGHGLIQSLARTEENPAIVAFDLRELPESLGQYCTETIVGDVRDDSLLEELAGRYSFGRIFHLAAMLSSTAEKSPDRAYEVNVGGTRNLLNLAVDERDRTGHSPMVLFPSTIAVYGLPSLEAKHEAGMVSEDAFLEPRTMYGCNKLAAEHLGRYYANHHRQVEEGPTGSIDFRAIRFPGLISAETLPTGGTTDYGPEMLHAAARNQGYECFVREDTGLPFMTMPEAVGSMLTLGSAPREGLTRTAYNVRSFSPTALEIHAALRSYYPALTVSFDPHPGRQMIVDGWPADVDDAAARADWGWTPVHSLESALETYLIPGVNAHYGNA
jgi:nucleoside-diphosphate-sugar epimerase